MAKIKKYPTKPFDCWGKAKELRMDIYKKLGQKGSGEKNWLVASGGTEGVIGLPAGLGDDYVPFGGEPYGASTAALGKSIEYMGVAEARGCARDICGYTRNYLGSMYKDEYVWGDHKIPLNQVRRLKQRTTEVNKLYKKYKGQYQRLIELHVDSRYQKQMVDIFFYHYPSSKKGKALCNTLYHTIKSKYNEVQPGRGYNGTIGSRKLYTLRHANPVSTYIELGNINHHRDQQRLVVVDNRQAIANWLTLGLIKDYKNSKK